MSYSINRQIKSFLGDAKCGGILKGSFGAGL
jgi:hypothetical protein